LAASNGSSQFRIILLMLQLAEIGKAAEHLQSRHGGAGLCAISGAGCCARPAVMFVFMNPTARNISAHPRWPGLRAPWLGTKHAWRLFERTGFLSHELASHICSLAPDAWTPSLSATVYEHLKERGVYVTNLAKCTQSDARPLPDAVFRQYRALMLREIALVAPERIITFGNQVSSVLLGKSVSVSQYTGTKAESLVVGRRSFAVYPTYYPVGQGMRNMPLAVRRIKSICRA
jgi:DNA polymerase